MNTEKIEQAAAKVHALGIVVERILSTLTSEQAAQVATELKLDIAAVRRTPAESQSEMFATFAEKELQGFQRAANELAARSA